jgi:hypothetical protein
MNTWAGTTWFMYWINQKYKTWAMNHGMKAHQPLVTGKPELSEVRVMGTVHQLSGSNLYNLRKWLMAPAAGNMDAVNAANKSCRVMLRHVTFADISRPQRYLLQMPELW